MNWLFWLILPEKKKTEEKVEAAQWSLIPTDLTPLVAKKVKHTRYNETIRELTVFCFLPFRLPTEFLTSQDPTSFLPRKEIMLFMIIYFQLRVIIYTYRYKSKERKIFCCPRKTRQLAQWNRHKIQYLLLAQWQIKLQFPKGWECNEIFYCNRLSNLKML